MLQIKLVQGKDIKSLNDAANEFLAVFDEDAVKDIKVDYDKLIALIQYVANEEWKSRMCCECQYWDDGGEPTTSGICHECGQRRRFNYKACECFKDVRGCK